MKNLKVVFALVFATIFILTSCQKDNLDDMTPSTDTSKIAHTSTGSNKKEVITFDPNNEVSEMTLSYTQATSDNAQSRNSKILIYEETTEVNQGSYRTFNLGNVESGYIYTSIVTPYNGDPDLYLYSDQDRYIDASTKIDLAVDEVELEKADLELGERGAKFKVYGYKKSRFQIKFYKERTHPKCPSPQPYNCSLIEVAYHTTPDGYQITGNNLSNLVVNRWELNTDIDIRITYDSVFTTTATDEIDYFVDQPGTYTICAYLECGGEIIKCCKEIVIQDNNDCHGTIFYDDFEDKSVGDRIHRYHNWAKNLYLGGNSGLLVSTNNAGVAVKLDNSFNEQESAMFSPTTTNNHKYELSYRIYIDRNADARVFLYDQHGQTMDRLIDFPHYYKGSWITVSYELDQQSNSGRLFINGDYVRSFSIEANSTLSNVSFHTKNDGHKYKFWIDKCKVACIR